MTRLTKYLLVGLSALAIVSLPFGRDTTRSPAATNGDIVRPALATPVTIQLHQGDDFLKLRADTDYILQMPTVVKTGQLQIRGGGNIEVVGGQMAVNEQGAANILIADGSTARWGRVVHLEGLLIEGAAAETDGIRISAPHSTVQLLNDRITGLHGTLDTVHADVIQPFGGVASLKIENFTGASHYNDFYFRRENNPLEPGVSSAWFKNVNMFGYTNACCAFPPTTLRAISLGTQPIPPSDNQSSVNCQLPGPVTFQNFYAQPPKGVRLGQFVYPHDRMQIAGCPARVTASGVTWPAWGSRITGFIQQGPPPGGDYAPAASVGLGYPRVD